MSRIFNERRIQFAIFVPFELSAVKLQLSFEITNAIDEESELSERRVTGRNRFLDSRDAGTLKWRVADRMLSDPPTGMRAIRTDERTSRPPMLGDNLLQARRVALVNLAHPWMVAICERARFKKFGADTNVFGFHGKKFFTQRGIRGLY